MPFGRAIEEAGADMWRSDPTRRADSRREVRQQATEAERALWNALRDRQVAGLKFRRQHPVKPYILDFCCLERRLAVEVDGDVHDWSWGEDEIRTAYLEELGYRVLRSRNEEILHNLAAVVAGIIHTAHSSHLD